MAGYAGAGPNAALFNQMLADWATANPGVGRHGGGPGDVGFGPGVMPDWFGGTAKQQAAVDAVAGNANLLHGWQTSPIPLWQINGEFPGGSGWHQGMALPPGWQVAGGGPSFLGPPVHQLVPPPVHQGPGGVGFLGPPVHSGDGGQTHYPQPNGGAKHPDPSYKTRQQMGEFRPALAALLGALS